MLKYSMEDITKTTRSDMTKGLQIPTTTERQLREPQ